MLPASLRRSTSLWRSPRLWRRRAAFWSGAVAVGVAAAGFAAASDWALHGFFVLREFSPVAASIVTIAGFALCGFLTKRYFPGARGSGIPQAIAAQAAWRGARFAARRQSHDRQSRADADRACRRSGDRPRGVPRYNWALRSCS